MHLYKNAGLSEAAYTCMACKANAHAKIMWNNGGIAAMRSRLDSCYQSRYFAFIYGIAMCKRHDLSRMPVKAASFKIVHTMDVSNSKANPMRLLRNSNPSW